MALKASKFAPEDFVSIMPDNVVTNILDRLPLQDAVRTSILSRSWRFKWTMLSQLVFDWKFFDYLLRTRNKDDHGRIISMILLHLKGTITKFLLALLDFKEIKHWILFLSGKGIKDLTLMDLSGRDLKLPTHLFSCLELTHLKLHNCYFNLPPSFHGFSNLLSLELRFVKHGSADLGELFTRCPLLEILNLGYLSSTSPIKLAEIAKVKTLKILSLTLCDLDTSTIISSHSIFELMGSLPKLQELHLDFHDYKLTEDGAKWMFPTAFSCLKTLELSKVDLGNGIMLSCVFEMIKRCPNLQTLEISAIQCDADPIPEVEYNTTRLRSVVATSFKGSENEVGLIKYVLACSPFLQKIAIRPTYYPDAHFLNSGEWLILARKLLKLHRASPIAEIDL